MSPLLRQKCPNCGRLHSKEFVGPLEGALRKIDSRISLPQTYLDQMEAGDARPAAEWWKFVASERREIARDALLEFCSERVAS